MSEISITVKGTNSPSVVVSIDPSLTIYDLKVKIAEHFNIPANMQRLVFKGKVLKDEFNISFYGINNLI